MAGAGWQNATRSSHNSWAGFSLLALAESDYLYCLQLGRKDRGMEGGREIANEQSQFHFLKFFCLLSAQKASLQNGMF